MVAAEQLVDLIERRVESLHSHRHRPGRPALAAVVPVVAAEQLENLIEYQIGIQLESLIEVLHYQKHHH